MSDLIWALMRRGLAVPDLALPPLLLLSLLLLPAWPLHARPLSAAVVRRQQHNVWFSGGCYVSGLVVNESTGDVFWSDAAANHVVQQRRNGDIVNVYSPSPPAAPFYSPASLALHNNQLYVADVTSNRVAVVDLASCSMSFLPQPPSLASCTALAVDPFTGDVYVLDGWGLRLSTWSVAASAWTADCDMASQWNWESRTPLYISSISLQPRLGLGVAVWVSEALLGLLIQQTFGYVDSTFQADTAVAAIQFVGNNSIFLLSLSQSPSPLTPAPAPLPTGMGDRQPAQVKQVNLDVWNQSVRPVGPGLGSSLLYGAALYVDSDGSMYAPDKRKDGNGSRIVKVLADGTEAGEWSMAGGETFTFVGLFYDSSSLSGGSCAFWLSEPSTERYPSTPSKLMGKAFGPTRAAACTSQPLLVAATSRTWREGRTKRDIVPRRPRR